MKAYLTDSVFFGAVISLAAYEAGLLIRRKFRLAILNPLLIATVCVMAVLMLFKIEYKHYNEGARYISYLLTPATVCLAVPLYQQLELLRKNLKAVAGGIITGVLASLVSVFLLAKLFSLTHEQYVTLLPKSITTAIGWACRRSLAASRPSRSLSSSSQGFWATSSQSLCADCSGLRSRLQKGWHSEPHPTRLAQRKRWNWARSREP